MLRAAVIERQKERRDYNRAALESLDMDLQVSAFSNLYDFEENLDEAATSYDMILLGTTVHQEGDGLREAADLRARNRRIMLCFLTDSPNYYKEAFDVFATGYLLYPYDVSRLHNCVSFFYQKQSTERRSSWMIKETGGSYRRI